MQRLEGAETLVCRLAARPEGFPYLLPGGALGFPGKGDVAPSGALGGGGDAKRRGGEDQMRCYSVGSARRAVSAAARLRGEVGHSLPDGLVGSPVALQVSAWTATGHARE